MRKLFQILLPTLIATLLVVGLVFAANTFPTSFNNWEYGKIIEADHLNAYEAKMGIDNSDVTTSLDYLIKHTSSKLGKIASLAVTDGIFIVGNGTTWVAESGATAKTSIGLGNVENTALSTWVGSGNITTIGTIASGDISAIETDLIWIASSTSWLSKSEWNATDTDALSEGSTNLYYTNARARASISETITGISYNNGTGVFSMTAGYNISSDASTTDWQTFYTTPSNRITAGTGLAWSNDTLNWSSTGLNWAGNAITNAYIASSTEFLADTTYSNLSEFVDDIGVSADWDAIGDVPTAAPSDGDTTHFSLADQIYDWVIGLGYQTIAGMNTFSELQAIVADEVLLASSSVDTFAELNTIVADENLLKAGTLTNAKYCTWDNANTDIVCNSEGGAGNGGVATTSPFTAGYIPYVTSSLAITNSNIFQSGLNIGIGTTSPSSILELYGSAPKLKWTDDGNYDFSIYNSGNNFYIRSEQYNRNVAQFLYSGYIIFNNDGIDEADFRVEGDTDQNLLFTDAGEDKVGIGTSTPSAKLTVGNADQFTVTAAGAIDATSLTLDTALDISGDTNLTGGRSITMNNDAADADAELYNYKDDFGFEDPVDDDDFDSIGYCNIAATIAGFYCETATGTVELDLNIDDGSPTGLQGAYMLCDSDGYTTTSFAGDTTCGAGDRIDLNVATSTVETDNYLMIYWWGTYDD